MPKITIDLFGHVPEPERHDPPYPEDWDDEMRAACAALQPDPRQLGLALLCDCGRPANVPHCCGCGN